MALDADDVSPMGKADEHAIILPVKLGINDSKGWINQC